MLNMDSFTEAAVRIFPGSEASDPVQRHSNDIFRQHGLDLLTACLECNTYEQVKATASKWLAENIHPPTQEQRINDKLRVIAWAIDVELPHTATKTEKKLMHTVKRHLQPHLIRLFEEQGEIINEMRRKNYENSKNNI